MTAAIDWAAIWPDDKATRSDRQIARELDCGETLVGRTRRGLGIEPFVRHGGARRRERPAPTPEEVAKWVRLFVDDCLSVKTICSRADVYRGDTTVSAALRTALGVEKLPRRD